MDKYIYHRLAGNGFMFTILSLNAILADYSMRKYLPQHPELKIFDSLSYRYATIWNLFLQIFYSFLAFICDYYTVKNNAKKISPAIRNFRFRIFHELVFPNCMGLAPFWPIYFFDRELVFPLVAEIVVTKWQNIICHGFIFIYVVWEMAFLPKEVPKRSEIKVTPILVIQTAYIISTLYSKYIQPGAWVYEILTYLEGSYLFFPMFFSIITCSVIGFYSQWVVKDCLLKLRDLRIKFKNP